MNRSNFIPLFLLFLPLADLGVLAVQFFGDRYGKVGPETHPQPGRFRSGALSPIAFIKVCKSSQASRFQAGLRRSADGW